MKYAVPLDNNDHWNSIVGQHFGHVPYFAIWDEETDTINMIENRSDHKGGVGLPMEFLADKCNGVFCKGAGARAVALGAQLGLQVYMGAVGTLKETIDFFKEGKLHKATHDDGCKH
ncbi:MAG: dinitrogenase iron-molybdenum cofactor biosynthesis protein [Candidatus Heimdallarchaeota archaeon]|nr:dinitrogenase iron-molybdenum cofactor biosynthesis protein [Candidatus Heimdallarchaeota archaeon]MCK4612835.1 dinitrogenase iron-molybdenum cofactor biosynthesis protein [Candidatus Heimdallarchaeota archaeon]